jgi:hypothetical protein
MNVFLTIDTEVYPLSSNWRGDRLQADIRRDIYGAVGGQEYGLDYQLRMFEEWQLKAVFFVEALFASCPIVGLDPLRRIVDTILSRGHDVQLHLHPEWCRYIPRFANITEGLISDCPLDVQRALLETGVENLQRCGVDVSTFRAGDFAANLDTLRALRSVGLKMDSSHNLTFTGRDSLASLGVEPLIQPQQIEGIWEIPVTCIEDWPGHFRHAQLGAISIAEFRRALADATSMGCWSFVIVSHTFEMLKNRYTEAPLKCRPVVVKRFDSLCRFLAENREQLPTAVFNGLRPEDIGAVPAAKVMKGNIVLTALRCWEQAIGSIM